MGEMELLKTKEVAALARKSESTLRYYAMIGEGPKSFKLGRTRLYARTDVEAWIAAARAGSDAQADVARGGDAT